MELDDLIREVYDYDPLTGKLTWKIKHNPHHEVGKEVGTYCTRGYRVTKLKGRQLKVHRICWFLYHGTWPGPHLDHINRVKDDNRIENLRDVTPRVNAQNIVNFNFGAVLDYRKVWVSKCWYKGKKKHLGSFETELDAQNAYREFVESIKDEDK